MHYGEHGRRFRARAQAIHYLRQEQDNIEDVVAEAIAGQVVASWGDEEEADEEEVAEIDEEDDEELQCLLFALRATDEADHELFYDLGARAHELGKVEDALALYQRAEILNARDPMLLGNMGAALSELGRPLAAVRCYRRALALDQYNVNARYNLGELMLERGGTISMRGVAALLADTPEETMRDAALQELAKMFESTQRARLLK
mmetsp:Transcript_56439/g.93278  ORF Transcript_56439/g.93278 Transcript_56439/m.93278 type:complete len:205 (-) Transcript_56439:93-707(-)